MSVWWASLQHGGLLIAPSKLAEFYPEPAWPLSGGTVDRLRRDVIRAQGGDRKALLDTVLELVLDLSAPGVGGPWLKGPEIPTTWTRRAITGVAVRPVRLWLGPHDSALPVFWDDAARLGIGAGRRTVARVIEWLRRDGGGLALLTNGMQWRLIHAGLDSDAFAEWDAGLWFEEGVPGPQVAALQTLLSVRSLGADSPGTPSLLLRAIEATRRGQAELSAELGEQVRRAVELLIEAHGTPLAAARVPPRQIYVAAVRVVMRMVVALFAEARDLLPRDNPLYNASYGLQGLREELERIGGGAGAARLRHRRGAWPRLLALFRLIHGGSPHEQLPVPAYGGGLFEAGDPDSSEAVTRALAVLEDPAHEVSDHTVLRVVELLTRARVKVRQGNRSTWVPMPVDFSDLSSEYIGILYEGLLDFELRRVSPDDPIIFLRLGDEPALPLSRLEQMDDGALGGLLTKFKQKTRAVVTEESGGEDDDEAEEDGGEQTTDEVQEPEGAEAGLPDPIDRPEVEEDERLAARERAMVWARRAVVAGGFAPRPRRRNAGADAEHARVVESAAEGLLSRIVLPGEWFLVRFGGTRKGSGTFYTRPALAVPTVQRTLRPLAYAPPTGTDGTPMENSPPAAWSPLTPDMILGLKVCDPAAGSGSFLVAALRFLTEALAESLHVHGRIRAQGNQTLVTLALGAPGGGALAEELLPCRPDAPEFDAQLRARLRRYVVERCLYGVDLDPLAVELGRMALWIETMDRSLPFGFLDHKLKCGNSLVGCWFDRFRDYPALAFEREGGDKTHGNGVHYEKGAWTNAIKAFRTDQLKPALVAWITGSASLFDTVEGMAPEAVHDEAMQVFEAMHALPVHESEERARLYREQVQGSPAVAALKQAFDTWCALWFWPADRLDAAPLPKTLAVLTDEGRQVVQALVAEHRFFHWELEFPDAFTATEGGFSAIIGNPPWETLQPQSKEFFSNLDPLYRSYGKQAALRRQKELFENSALEERTWLLYIAQFKALGAFTEHVAAPFGDPTEGATLALGRGNETSRTHERWRRRRVGRVGYADREHAYRHQGAGKAFTYKLFTEQAWTLLRRGGQLGFVIPAGIHTDKGTSELRKLLLGRGNWRWLFGFENRDGIFDIARSLKFCAVIAGKGGVTDVVQTAFMKRDLSDWAKAEEHAIPYHVEQVRRFSPFTGAILEIRNVGDREMLDAVYSHSSMLGDPNPAGPGTQYSQGDFNMTSDSELFQTQSELASRDYLCDEYGRWLLGPWQPRAVDTPTSATTPRWELPAGVILSRDGGHWIDDRAVNEIALPLYQGVMIWQLDYAATAYQAGSGLSAQWEGLEGKPKRVASQYHVLRTDVQSHGRWPLNERIAFRDVQNAINQRTMIAALVPGFPCGNTVPLLALREGVPTLSVLAALVSFPCDRILRMKMSQNHVNWFYAEELPVPVSLFADTSRLAWFTLRVCAPGVHFAALWLRATVQEPEAQGVQWRKSWALTEHERLRIRCSLDAVICAMYGLSITGLVHLLEDCDLPQAVINARSGTGGRDQKGFWRVDKEKDPELRHTILSIVAFHELQALISEHAGDTERGIEAFLAQNDGEGWMIPETLRLSDYGLGQDERARQHQPVRERLGPRFFEFQLEQSVEDSWKECRLHARNLLGEVGYAALERELAGEAQAAEPKRKVAEPGVAPNGGVNQPELFDQ